MTAPSSPDLPLSADLRALLDDQRARRWQAAQTTAAQRQALLRRLSDAVKAHRVPLAEALRRDLGKSRAEAELMEIHPVLEEISHAIRRLPRWMAPRRIRTPLMLVGSRSEIRLQPRGVTLILSPWNYPVNLALAPLVASLAAGNTVILKPSEKAPHVARALHDLIAGVFDPALVSVVQGDADTARALISLGFDHILFTGSTAVGRQVMQAAAASLTSVTLELGGKSPAIVDPSADLHTAAERIAWGKFLNAGQTCVAPDYVLVHEDQRDALVSAMRGIVARRFGSAGWLRAGPDYGRMVNRASVERLERLTRDSVSQGAQVALGGDFDPGERFISPTLVVDVTPGMPLMQEELFGPVLPLLTYRAVDDALEFVRRNDPPLALYLFARDADVIERTKRETASGGMVVNGTIIHLSNPHLPFGGVGTSGMGAYHGEHGFRAFSHERAIMHEGPRSSVRFTYPPYGRPLMRLAAWGLRALERQTGPRD